MPDDYLLSGTGLRITTRLYLAEEACNLPHCRYILDLNCFSIMDSDLGLILKKVGERTFICDATSGGRLWRNKDCNLALRMPLAKAIE